jgi:hypothetical protein
MGSTQRKMQCLGPLLAGSLLLTTAVYSVLPDPHFSVPPTSAHTQVPADPVQIQARQAHWQRPGPLQSKGIEWAERINEQMMRQRYQEHRNPLKELR